jgi:hypothetical protein
MNRRLLFPTLLLLVSPALAQEKANVKPQIPQPRYELECRAQFGPKATHADLVKAYGAKNVTFGEVTRAEGEKVKATILFAKDPTRRLEIEWFDEKRRARPSVITVFKDGNQWTGPLGIQNGLYIWEIEKLAGKPFKINGFEFDVAGAMHIEGTKLEKLPGGCKLGGHFDIDRALPHDLIRFVGEVEIDSNDPDLLKLNPKLWIFTLSYPAANN